MYCTWIIILHRSIDTFPSHTFLFRCIVHGLSFYIGVLTPVCLILLFNIIVVITTLITISKPSMASKKMSVWERCRITLFISLLLGGTWLFALFAVGGATEAFQVLFCIVTSLQGFFVFLLLVALKKDMRNVVRGYFRKTIRKAVKIQSEDKQLIYDVSNTIIAIMLFSSVLLQFLMELYFFNIPKMGRHTNHLDMLAIPAFHHTARF